MTVVFTAKDIDYLVNHFSVEQLRIEIKNARNNLHREYDWQWQLYYEDFIRACQLALELIEPQHPTKYHTNQQLETPEVIKQRYDLVEYAGQYIRLKKSGDKFQGLCPFHADKKSSSFFIYPNNTFHCFGCQAHGSIIDFVMKYENLDIKSALTKLSR